MKSMSANAENLQGLLNFVLVFLECQSGIQDALVIAMKRCMPSDSGILLITTSTCWIRKLILVIPISTSSGTVEVKDFAAVSLSLARYEI